MGDSIIAVSDEDGPLDFHFVRNQHLFLVDRRHTTPPVRVAFIGRTTPEFLFILVNRTTSVFKWAGRFLELVQ